MRDEHKPPFMGIDFGTTNTVVSLCNDTGATRTLVYPSAQGPQSTFRSILCYVSEDGDGLHAQTQVYCGPAAIDAFLHFGEDARLIQSVKTFLSSKTFSKSAIHGREYTLEQIVADFLGGLLRAAEWPPEHGGAMPALAGNVTVGRPVKFAGGGSSERGRDCGQASAWGVCGSGVF